MLASLQATFPDVNLSFSPSTPETNRPIISNANIIVTATSSREPLFESDAVSAGTRLVLIGSYTPAMKEVDDELIRRAGTIVVDSKEACGHEAGELLSAGIRDDGMVELGTLLDGQRRRVEGDVTIFKSVSLMRLARQKVLTVASRSVSGCRTQP
jgi:ornithine cyclodeaminase/alanine dehydrogenase-like protein (mu-crystallin family)